MSSGRGTVSLGPNIHEAHPTEYCLMEDNTVDSKKLEYASGTIWPGFPSFLGFGVQGQSYSNFLASTVHQCNIMYKARRRPYDHHLQGL